MMVNSESIKENSSYASVKLFYWIKSKHTLVSREIEKLYSLNKICGYIS